MRESGVLFPAALAGQQHLLAEQHLVKKIRDKAGSKHFSI
jgi:hypothetical protein